MKSLLKYFKGYRASAIFGPLFKLVEAILELLVPMIVALIIDVAIPTGDIQTIVKYIMMMFGIAAAGLAFSITAQYLSARAAVGFTENLTADLFDFVLQLPKEVYGRLTPGSIVTRVTSDTFQIQSGLNTFFRLFLRSPFIVFGSLIMASQIDARMTMIFVMMIVVLFVIVGGVIYFANPLFVQIREQFDQLVTLTQEQMKGMRVIRAFRQTQREINEFEQQNNQVTLNQIKVGFINAFTNPFTYIVVNVALIIVLWQGGHFINAGTLTQGQLVALVNYLLAILVELIKIAFIITQLNRAYSSVRRVITVFEQPVESKEFTNAKELMPSDKGVISFQDVTFTYPEATKPSLSNIDFTINQGDFIGIIGSTGSGKSTLLQLITKTYDAQEGEVVFDEDYFNTRTRRSLRESMSVVPSNVALFKGTIRSNLLMGNPQATDEMMWSALEDAQALEFVSQYPEGLDKEVATFGRNFSGGQRQRLTIARALIKPASLLIFDDSTSALDYVTEANFQKTLKEKYNDMTIIMISQRTHSLQQADNIVVLEEGQQIGYASHDELLETNPVYQEIYASQNVEEVAKDGTTK